MREKRILWLLNHDTLSKFELPLIRDLGYEIYTPKITFKEVLQASGSITYDYDSTLTIPSEDLEILNQYDFTSWFDMPLRIKKIINLHFATAITYTDTAFLILKKLIHNFEGDIFFRAFGVGLSRFQSYTELMDFYLSSNDIFKLHQIKERFWFSQCYPNLAEIEENIYADNAVYMPLGLPKEFYEIEDQWHGSRKQLLFFCTRIKYVPEAEEIYNQFKLDFKGFDYIIAGNQPIPVDDDRVTGFMERDALNDIYKSCKVMYYHSTNPRHLHYHPLEAMIAGMPVVYMEGGLLSILGGDSQAGRCNNISEARVKVQKILDGDLQLIEDIIKDQKEIISKFSYEYNRVIWEENFIPLIKNRINSKKTSKISVFFPEELENCHFLDYINIIDSLNKGLREVNKDHTLTVNLPNKLKYLTKEIHDKKYPLREYELKTLSASEVSDSLLLMFKNSQLWHKKYTFPVDYTDNYIQDDLWIFLDGDINIPIAPLKPYGVFVESIASRHYETISEIQIYNLKNASFIITISEQVRQDLIQHLGISKEIIFLIPLISEQTNSYTKLLIDEEYILFEMNLNNREQAIKVMNQILDFYRLVGNKIKIKLYFNKFKKADADVGDTKLLDELNVFIQKSVHLKENVTLYTNVDKYAYDALYYSAKKIVFPFYVPNLYYKLAKAASFSKNIIIDSLLKDSRFFEENLTYSNYAIKQLSTIDNTIIEVLNGEDNKTDKEVIIGNGKLDEVSDIWRKLL